MGGPGSLPPLDVIASWPPPNYVNPEVQGPALLITCITLSVLGIMVVAARLYARLVITKASGLDDVIIVIALLLAIGSSILAVYGAEVLYVGHHIWDVPVATYPALRMNAWISQWFYVGALCAVKVSILLFYRRLSVTFSNFFLWATWIGISYNVLGFVAYCLCILLECRPTSAYWLSTSLTWIVEGHKYSCSNIEHIVLPLFSGLGVIGDFYSTTLPLCLVYSLQMSRRQKMSLYFLFALGYLVVGAGIFKTIYIYDLLNQTYDATWVYYESMIWTTVEAYFAIYCASAPGLKPFVKRFFIEPMTQGDTSQNRRLGRTFSSSIKKWDFLRHRSDTYPGDRIRDEESGAQSAMTGKPSGVHKQEMVDKAVATVHETEVFFNNRARHSLIHDETLSRFEQYPRAQQPSTSQYEHQHRQLPSQSTISNTTHLSNYDSDEPATATLQILDDRVYQPSNHVEQFIMDKSLPPTPESSASSPNGHDLSIIKISASPLFQPRVPSRTNEQTGEVNESESDLELPLQNADVTSPANMPATGHQRRLRVQGNGEADGSVRLVLCDE